jgi:hypothetical protein
MFPNAMHRLFRPIAFALIAAQLLLSAPLVNALESLTSGSTPCAEIMSGGDHHAGCPCCPDGVTSMAGCLAACTAAVGIMSTSHDRATRVLDAAPVAASFEPTARTSEPPLKPPPIV